MWTLALQSFILRTPLMSSQHFPVWLALQMSVQVRPHDLASARHVQLSVRMSALVSISINQFSNFEESCPSNVGISWEHGCGEIGFPVLHAGCPCIPIWSCALVPHWTGRVGWSIMVRCCSLSVSCNSSFVSVDWGVLRF